MSGVACGTSKESRDEFRAPAPVAQQTPYSLEPYAKEAAHSGGLSLLLLPNDYFAYDQIWQNEERSVPPISLRPVTYAAFMSA